MSPSRIRHLAILALVATRVAIFVLTLSAFSDPSGDAVRSAALSRLTGHPYLDYQAEYPPLGLAIRIAIGQLGPAIAHIATALLAFGCDLIVIRLLGGQAPTYLLVTTPLLIFLYERLELVSVVLTLLAVDLAERGRQRTAGLLFAAGVFDKLWPGLLIPWLLVQRRARAAAWAAGATTIGFAAWVISTRGRGPLQVLTFRHASGWNIESTPGIMSWLVSGGQPMMDRGSLRIGTAVPWILTVLLGAQLVVWALGWGRALQKGTRSPAITATFVTAVTLILSPLFSPQFVMWMVPWAVISGDRDVAKSLMYIALATAGIAAMNEWGGPTPLYQYFVVSRALVLGVLAGSAWRAAT